MTRRVVGLQAVELGESPWGKAPRPKGAKALGLRFERAVGRALPGALHGQWLKFVDNNGKGFCQPDILFSPRPGVLCVVECKLTDTMEAEGQLKHLYMPLVGKLFDGELRPIIVVKYLSPFTQPSRIVGSWDEALAHPSPILHAFSKRELAPPKGGVFPPEFSRSCFHYSEADSLPHRAIPPTP